MKKKILIRIGSLRHGGAEKVLVTFLSNLKADKCEVDLKLLNINYYDKVSAFKNSKRDRPCIPWRTYIMEIISNKKEAN